MKKSKILILLLALVLFIPSMVNALSVERVFTTLDDYLTPLEKEELNYTETSDQVIIYLFRGEGCSHCKEFIDYLTTSLVKTHGAKFKLRAYEVWYNKDNKNLMEKAAKIFDEKADGVPYIVIGKKSWKGYTDSYKVEIENAIDEEYGNYNKYDILDEIKKVEKEEEKAKKETFEPKKTDKRKCERQVEESEAALSVSILLLVAVSIGSGLVILALIIGLICVGASNAKKKDEIVRLNLANINLQNEISDLSKTKEKKNEKK